MKRYEKYKDSSVAWLGEIPEHWKLAPIKHLFEFTTGFTPPTTKEEYYDGDLDWVTIADMNTKYISESKSKITKKAVDDLGKQPIPKGSLMYSFKLSVGKVGFATKELYTNEAIFSIFPNDELCLDYYYYALQDILIYNANENIYGAKLLNQELILNSLLPKIDIAEQQKIAEYLDYTVGRVDEMARQKEVQIERLQSYRKSMINEVVTKGLNPDAPMRDSGIDWLGSIPAHWKLTRLRFLCDITTGTKDTENRIEDGEYPFFVRSQTVERINSVGYDGEAILTAGDGVGVCKVWHYVNGKFDFHQRVYMLYNFRKVSGKFAFEYLRSNFINDVLKLSAKSTVDSLRMPMFQNFYVAYPLSIDEQTKIVDHIEERTTKIDKIVEGLKSQIDKLKEYKRSIISEAVTGKIDLREWVEPKKS